jgi:hypothetical protein
MYVSFVIKLFREEGKKKEKEKKINELINYKSYFKFDFFCGKEKG